MFSVKSIYELARPTSDGPVVVQGLLLGTGFDHYYFTDSVEAFDEGMALPILGPSIFEELFESGVSPIGGGRFSFRYKAIVEANVVSTELSNFKYGLANITSLVVIDHQGKRVTVIPFSRKAD